MSLTGLQHVFAGINESGINTFLRAFFTARPHYLNYGSVPFVSTTTTSATNIPPIPFPGIPAGISYLVQFAIPVVDLFPPDSSGATAALPPGQGQFTIGTRVRITVGCESFDPDHRKPSLTPIETELGLLARGSLFVLNFGPGNGEVGFKVDEVKIIGIAPESLAAVLDCIIRMILQVVLDSALIPFKIVTIEAFSIILQRGPEIKDDQIELFGDI